MDRIYSARVDGHEILQVTLSKSQYTTQGERDKVRQIIAKDRSIPAHYIRLVNLDQKQYYDDLAGKRFFFDKKGD